MSGTGINDELIVRYLTGDADPDEAVAVADWLKVEENRAYFSEFAATWRQAAGEKELRPDKPAAWKRVSEGLHIPASQATRGRSLSTVLLGIAAVLLAVAMASYFLFFSTPPQPARPLSAVTTTDGFRFVEFPDRSAVTLNRQTELQYPDQFDHNSRRVRLIRGEAFFSVTSDAGRPFIVEANGVEIRVLGTEFNVQIQEAATVIHVREGRVLVRTTTDSATLLTGLTGSVNGGHIAVTDYPVGNLYSYATQRLVFDDATLGQVIRDLEESYPYTFELKNPSLENCRLTANFYKDDIDKIVNLVAETLNLTVAKNGRHFTLEGEGCL